MDVILFWESILCHFEPGLSPLAMETLEVGIKDCSMTPGQYQYSQWQSPMLIKTKNDLVADLNLIDSVTHNNHR